MDTEIRLGHASLDSQGVKMDVATILAVLIGPLTAISTLVVQHWLGRKRRREEFVMTAAIEPLEDIRTAIRDSEVLYTHFLTLKGDIHGRFASLTKQPEDMMANFSLSVARAGTSVDAIDAPNEVGQSLNRVVVLGAKIFNAADSYQRGYQFDESAFDDCLKEMGELLVALKRQYQELVRNTAQSY